MRLFTTDDGQVGFALKGDDIISVFKHPDSNAKNIVASILPLAVQEGGRRLDCFDTVLPELYSLNGFRAVSRTPFDENYQPEGWDKELFKAYNGGKPDVVFMVYDENAKPYAAGDGKTFASYDDATVAQKAAAKTDKSGRAFAPVAEYVRSLFRYNENHDPDNGQFTSDGGGGSGSSSPSSSSSSSTGSSSKSTKSSAGSKTSASSKSSSTTAKPATTGASDKGSSTGAKVKAKIADFTKDKVNLGRFASDKAKADRFVDTWDEKVGMTPAEFKDHFLGGINANMSIDIENDGRWNISGEVLNAAGRRIGTYTRYIDIRNKTAESSYFALDRGNTRGDLGKKMLAGNIELYQKLGVERVKVHANIDVGGYAWAKYGYVPDRSSWSSLSSDILDKLGGGSGSSSGGSGYQPESWDEIGDHDQNEIKDAWMRSTRDEFIQSEIDSWRDSGNAIDDAKSQVATDYDGSQDWALDAIQEWIDDRDPEDKQVPYTASQIAEAISLDYASGNEGQGDLGVEFDDDKLKEPSNAPAKEQGNLPGIDPEDLSQRLTETMRDELTAIIEKQFDKHADSVADNLDPPEYIYDSVDDYQSEYWESMDDTSRFRWARDNGSLPEYDDPDEEQSSFDMDSVDPDAADGLEKLARSSDPKALWAIADSEQGKELLLGSDWYGTLNLKDPQTMERFNAYVGKKKAA
ncbi:hypothetical protein [Bradyrhizobium sp. S3.7.6]